MRLAHVFFEVHMGASHKALSEMLAEAGADLLPNECAIFINRQWTRIKMLCSAGQKLGSDQGTIILYLNRPGGIMPAAVKHLPSYVGGSRLNYDQAVLAALREEHGKNPNRKQKNYDADELGAGK